MTVLLFPAVYVAEHHSKNLKDSIGLFFESDAALFESNMEIICSIHVLILLFFDSVVLTKTKHSFVSSWKNTFEQLHQTVVLTVGIIRKKGFLTPEYR